MYSIPLLGGVDSDFLRVQKIALHPRNLDSRFSGFSEQNDLKYIIECNDDTRLSDVLKALNFAIISSFLDAFLNTHTSHGLY